MADPTENPQQTQTQKKPGLQRGNPNDLPVDTKIAQASRWLDNDKIEMTTGRNLSPDDPRRNLDEYGRSSHYIGTNIAEFTAEQQETMKKAIMSADSRTGVHEGKKYSSIEDVKFLKGKNGSTVIEIKGLNADVDLEKLKKLFDEQKDKLKEVKINEDVKKPTPVGLNTLAPGSLKGVTAASVDTLMALESSPPTISGKGAPVRTNQHG